MSLTAHPLGTILLAATGEPSKIPFYVAGGLLVAWAALVSFLGLRQADFPGTPGRARAVMAISAILVLGATSMAVATSAKKKHEKGSATDQGGAPAPPGSAGASGATTVALAADPTGQLRYDSTTLTAHAGRVNIDFTNRSPVMHNVTILADGKTLATPTITGSTATLSATLKPGSYTFYCSVDSHRLAGMQGTLTVR